MLLQREECNGRRRGTLAARDLVHSGAIPTQLLKAQSSASPEAAMVSVSDSRG